MTKIAKRPVGRPRASDAEATKFVTLNIPLQAKKDLEAIKEHLERQVGFSVSLSDTVRHLIKLHSGRAK
jgi:hypothetical protein